MWDYEELLQADEDREHLEHAPMLEWVGGVFDLAAFDLEAVNETLATLRS